MKLNRSKKKTKRNRFEKMRMESSRNKYWNIFAGDDHFKTNLFLEFEKPSMKRKYEKDMSIRLKYTLNSFIIIYILLTMLLTNIGMVAVLLYISLGVTLFYWQKKWNNLFARILLIIPIWMLQQLLAFELNWTFMMVLILELPIDLCTLHTWRKHFTATIIQVMILFLWKYQVVGNNKVNGILKLASLSDSISLMIFIAIDIMIFVQFEKLFKESWVIRETTQKSFKTFYSVYDKNHREQFIIDESLQLLFMNTKFEETMKKLIDSKYPSHLKEFVHENSYEGFKDQLILSIKQKKYSSSSVCFLRLKERSSELPKSEPKKSGSMNAGKIIRTNIISASGP